MSHPDAIKDFLIKRALDRIPREIVFGGTIFSDMDELKAHLETLPLKYNGGTKFFIAGFCFDSRNWPRDVNDIKRTIIKDILAGIK